MKKSDISIKNMSRDDLKKIEKEYRDIIDSVQKAKNPDEAYKKKKKQLEKLSLDIIKYRNQKDKIRYKSKAEIEKEIGEVKQQGGKCSRIQITDENYDYGYSYQNDLKGAELTLNSLCDSDQKDNLLSAINLSEHLLKNFLFEIKKEHVDDLDLLLHSAFMVGCRLEQVKKLEFTSAVLRGIGSTKPGNKTPKRKVKPIATKKG